MADLERLWAPWRIGFLVGPKPDTCFLCECPAQADDASNLIVERGRTCFAILNRYPYNNGHLLVAPYRHSGDLADLSPEEMGEMMAMAQRWTQVMGERMNADGFNLGLNVGKAAGAGVADHLHMHVVPRWQGDINFMSVMTDVRVVNQSLLETRALLVESRAEDVPTGPGGSPACGRGSRP